MKKFVIFSVAFILCFVLTLTACNTNPATSSSSQASNADVSSVSLPTTSNPGQSTSSTLSGAETATTTARTTTMTTTTTTTTTAEETEVTTVAFTSTEHVPPTTEAAPIAPSTPPSEMAFANLDYWAAADAFRVCHTQGPPFKAVTLKKGTEEYDRLLALLQRVEGTYLGISHEGLAGGFMPIFVYQGATELDRLCISVSGEARFSTDTQQEVSKRGLSNTDASLYTMSEDLAEEINEFFESLEYTEDI